MVNQMVCAGRFTWMELRSQAAKYFVGHWELGLLQNHIPIFRILSRFIGIIGFCGIYFDLLGFYRIDWDLFGFIGNFFGNFPLDY